MPVSTADDRWTLPEPGSRYPLALLGRGIEPEQASVRFFGILAMSSGSPLQHRSVVGKPVRHWLGWLLDGRPGTLTDYSTRSTAFETVAGLVAANLAIGSAILVVFRTPTPAAPRKTPGSGRCRPACAGASCWHASRRCGCARGVAVPDLWRPGPEAAAGHRGVRPSRSSSPRRSRRPRRRSCSGVPHQALGWSWRREWFAVVGSALLFALFHAPRTCRCSSTGSSSAHHGALAWRTGGLEASIGAHIAQQPSAPLVGGADELGFAQAGAIRNSRGSVAVGGDRRLRCVRPDRVGGSRDGCVCRRQVGAGLSLARPLR